ncbi:MAG: sigma-70 family RNA polymerase sigma factor, partial [Lachnospiraceae bacterium]|nr:sigma-70 family RNA polymerase sigma factor [Lachnospiraceae bacterium]
PRSVRQKQKAIDTAVKILEKEIGPNYSDSDMAKELGISEDEYLNWLSQTNISNISSIEDFLDQGNEVKASSNRSYARIEPEKVVEESELKEKLEEALDILTEKEKKVILLYYYEDLTLKEISRVMDVSESRVSQLHSKALKKLKNGLGDEFQVFMG